MDISFYDIHPSQSDFMAIKKNCHNEFKIPLPIVLREEWDDLNVYLPHNSKNVSEIKDASTNQTISINIWEEIKKSIPNEISNVDELKSFISFHYKFNNNKINYNFDNLELYFAKNDVEKNKYFFKSMLPLMIKHLLMIECTITAPIPVLTQYEFTSTSSITLSQYQIFVLLINAFFCTFPEKHKSKKMSKINFNSLFSKYRNNEHNVEKIKCLMNYFAKVMINEKHCLHLVSFIRKTIDPKSFPNWTLSNKKLSPIIICSDKKIEDRGNTLYVDFANAYVGGGVIGNGLVQEEILFLIHPELIISKLFTEKLLDNEVLFITGFERFNNYKGYGSTFKFDGDYDDKSKVVKTEFGNKRLTYMVAMDALKYFKSHHQYYKKHIIRELNKCYVAFLFDDKIEKSKEQIATISTGNWGCGAFGGDPELKFLIQLLAASYCDRKIIYSTFGDMIFENKIKEIYSIFEKKSVTVSKLFNLLISYNQNNQNQSLFNFIINSF